MVVSGHEEREITIPAGVSASLSGDTVSVRGKAGEVRKRFDFGRIDTRASASKLVLSIDMPSKAELAKLNTIVSEIKTMMEGVLNGYEYRLRIVYAHFPIKVQVKGQEVIIENFLGERYPRKARIEKGARVSVTGDQVVVSSPDIEGAGQTAANIERATRIKNYDKRVFQDGIYIVSKAGKLIA
ncbi:MAG: 50S ribosomal protein L6 [Thermoplasmata archaeon]|uniref:Large ribosomal subunit protein uL6 n=1 Tax=Candidatus Sysuiplasma superficiale TaxID=2823368 RepID=A0A8J8CGS5_9ARCH|nr:50S ribosomal protein L6 [Candidatus Sysuiplasma superficiale]MBX8644681.1 50S ribosomal protein L6 [Candidatus Sysuiplasma superficiale]